MSNLLVVAFLAAAEAALLTFAVGLGAVGAIVALFAALEAALRTRLTSGVSTGTPSRRRGGSPSSARSVVSPTVTGHLEPVENEENWN